MNAELVSGVIELDHFSVSTSSRCPRMSKRNECDYPSHHSISELFAKYEYAESAVFYAAHCVQYLQARPLRQGAPKPDSRPAGHLISVGHLVPALRIAPEKITSRRLIVMHLQMACGAGKGRELCEEYDNFSCD